MTRIIIATLLICCSIFMNANKEFGNIDYSKHVYSFHGEDYRITDTCSSMIVISKGGKMGFANANGELILAPYYDLVFPFKTTATVVVLNRKYGVISNSGKIVMECEYQEIKPFNCSITTFAKDNRWGIVSAKGKFILPLNYQFIHEVHDEMTTCLTMNGRFILVNNFGQIIDTLATDTFQMDDFMENHEPIGYPNLSMAAYPIEIANLYEYHNGIAIGKEKESGKYCYVNKKNEPLFDKTFLKLRPFVNGLACVKTEKGWNIIDLEGNYTLTKWYSSLWLKEDLIIVREKDEYGVIDLKENILIPVKYRKISILDKGLFAFSIKGKWGVITALNEIIMEPIYEGIGFDTFTKIGRAGIYDNSVSLNTGIPRYNYMGHYFEFNEKGKISEVSYSYGMLVEFIADWHSEDFDLSGSHLTFAPEMDVHQYGFTINKKSNSEPNALRLSIETVTSIVDDIPEKKISKDSITQATFYPNCILVTDQHQNTIFYDLLGEELYKGAKVYISGSESGLFRAYKDGKTILINCRGKEIKLN